MKKKEFVYKGKHYLLTIDYSGVFGKPVSRIINITDNFSIKVYYFLV